MVLLLEVVGTTVVWGVVGLGVLTEPENGQGTNTKRGGKEESKTNHLNNKVTLRHFTTAFFLMLQTQTNRKNRKRLRHSD